MGKKREKWYTKFEFDSDDDGGDPHKARKKPVIDLSNSDDDAEANEDLSLQIIHKSMMLRSSRAVDSDGDRGIIDISSSPSPQSQPHPVGVSTAKRSRKEIREKSKKKKKEKTVEAEVEELVDADVVVVGVEEAEKAQVAEEAMEERAPTADNNIVLRKLLRGPRYFDPPGTSAGCGSCFNCGEEGHLAANCTAAKRKKPCFICGSLEHNAKACTEGQDCFICKRGGHRAKDCPDKYKSSSTNTRICLKCGDSGHDMFLCRNDYASDDLKEIQCYTCNDFGHLCCAKYEDSRPGEVSCYQCGQLGHAGFACTRSGQETQVGSLSCCYKCGEQGHFARECLKQCTRSGGAIPAPSSLALCYRCGKEGHIAKECTEVRKRNMELLTPNRKAFKNEASTKDKNYMGVRSVPRDHGRSLKKTRPQYEETSRTSYKSRQRGGWIPEDPGESYYQNTEYNYNSRFPVTPANRNRRIVYDEDQFSNSHSFINSSSRFRTPTSQDSVYAGHHRFSAVRYGGDYSSGGMRQNYSRW